MLVEVLLDSSNTIRVIKSRRLNMLGM